MFSREKGMSIDNTSSEAEYPDNQGPPDPSEPGGVPADDSDDALERFQVVYNQYWKHARHNEDQLWSFTRAWALILTGIFAALGAPQATVSTRTKIGIAAFGIILSVLGFALVYTIRKPFLIYFRTAHRIARDRFGIPSRYLRVKTEMDHTLGKRVTTSSILFTTYAGVTAILMAFILVTYDSGWFGLSALEAMIFMIVVVTGTFGCCHRFVIKGIFEEICDDVIGYNDEDGVYDPENDHDDGGESDDRSAS